MKHTMMEVIDKVINERYIKFDKVESIQLSSTLMRKFIEELKDFTSYITNNISGIQFTELEYKRVRVYNREYRDDTNDPDVEEELYNLAQTL